jgi:transcriptional regulator with XRE-family HTH domain
MAHSKHVFPGLGASIKARRQELGLSQGRLAGLLGYHTSQYISNIERGLCNLPLEKLGDYAKILRMERLQLLLLLLEGRNPGLAQEIRELKHHPGAGDGRDGYMAVPVLTAKLFSGWEDAGDLLFPAKTASRGEWARTADEHAFFFEADAQLPALGIDSGDLLLAEPHSPLKHGALVLRNNKRRCCVGKVVIKKDRVVFVFWHTSHPDVEALPRETAGLFPVVELRKRFAPAQ